MLLLTGQKSARAEKTNAVFSALEGNDSETKTCDSGLRAGLREADDVDVPGVAHFDHGDLKGGFLIDA